jgi:diaminopimelate epimerase
MSKYEALGNDFLILFDAAHALEIPPSLVAALCDRHRGIGADGLMHLRPTHHALAMVLTNADGSPAEVSGNGLRCAALAAFDAGFAKGTSVSISTVVGMRRADLLSGGDGSAEIRVEMGAVHVEATPSPLATKQAYRASVGNPHLVLFGERIDDVDLGAIGPGLESAVPGGQNVEVISLRTNDELDFIVFERGAGITEACGTGSVAAAAAARLAGDVGDVVTVHNPGGPLVVELSGTDYARPIASLAGPTRRVAEVQVRREDFENDQRNVGENLSTR